LRPERRTFAYFTWLIAKNLGIKGIAVARKKTADQTDMSGDKVSPDLGKRKPREPLKTDGVKVANGRVTKTPAKKAPAKHARAAKKPAAVKPKTPAAAKAPGKARVGAAAGQPNVRNPVDLSKKQLQAMETASLHGLDERQAKFIDLWLVTQNGTLSYLEAGFECKSDAVAAAAASRLLRKVREHPYLLLRRAELFQRTAEVQERVISRIYGAAMADPRELVEYIYTCCRYCHGLGFGYQFTPRQMREREEEYELAKREAAAASPKRRLPPLDRLGGLGYDATRDPHEDCPECFGRGHGQLVLKDTRHLSPAALALYGGVEETKDGLKVRIAEQRQYLELLGRLFNMNVEPAAPPVAIVSKEQLEEVYQRAQRNTDKQREDMAERAAAVAALDPEGQA